MKIYADKLSSDAQNLFLEMIIQTRVNALLSGDETVTPALDELDRLYVKACVATKLAESEN